MEHQALTLEIGRILRKYRRSKKISKAKMSKLSGVSEMAIVNLELGQHSSNMATILKIMNVLGLKFNFYVADEWEPLDENVEYKEQGWGMALGNYREVMLTKKQKKIQEELDRIEAEKGLLSPGAEVEDDTITLDPDEDLSVDNFFGPGKAIKKKDPHDIDTSGDEALPVF